MSSEERPSLPPSTAKSPSSPSRGESSEPDNETTTTVTSRPPPKSQPAAVTSPSTKPSAAQPARTKLWSSSPTAGNSPRTSRNASPIRKDKPTPLAGPLSTQPSAAAIQRAISASVGPTLQSSSTASDAASRLPRGGQRGGNEGNPSWQASPRLKSPPPSATNPRRITAVAPKKADPLAPPEINVMSATPQDKPPVVMTPGDAETSTTEQPLQPPPPKPASRGPGGKSVLETVQENSADSLTTTKPASKQSASASDLKPLTKIDADENRAKSDDQKAEDGEHEAAAPVESGSESAGTKSDHGPRRASRAGHLPAQPQRAQTEIAPRTTTAPVSASASTRAARQPEAKPNMTVETETVQSIPHSALATSDRLDSTGSIKRKQSSETMRARKGRKKLDRKPKSVNQGTVKSKSDLFEARVASAVDEANTSESDETFVYESNPPESRRQKRQHSRTPSVTSANSTTDGQRGSIRNIADAFDGSKRVSGKRSMKFSSHSHNDPDTPQTKDPGSRSHHPRHTGKLGRINPGANHEPDSPFTAASKQRQQAERPSRGPSRAASVKSVEAGARRSDGIFGHPKPENGFDFDAEGADDERTPLVNANRTPRAARDIYMNRGLNGNGTMHSRHGEPYYDESPVRRPPRKWCGGRTGICLSSALLFVALIAFTVGFLVAANRPLAEVRIRRIENILASKEELMLDLVISAVNPNPLGITISDMDVNLFAKSKHVGTGPSMTESTTALTAHSSSNRRRRRRQRDLGDALADFNPAGGLWPWPDPDDPDQDQDAQTMLLGRIFFFDEALYFQGSLIQRHRLTSTGGLRLARPGNETETGGSARWERTIQHPFELIVRGVLRYQLPLSGRLHKASVSAAVMVHPEDGSGDEGGQNMRVEPVDESEKWEWIEWPDLEDDDDENVNDVPAIG